VLFRSGQQQAATKDAEAIRTRAQAERDAATLTASGEQARQMVPVNVTREQVAVDAARVQDVEAARVQVLRNELSAKAEYEQISVQLEQALAAINARREVGVAFAQAFGEALSKAQMNLYGDPAMLGSAMSAFTRAAGVGAFMDGMKSTAPEGSLDTLLSLVQNALPKVKEALSPNADAPAEAPAPDAPLESATPAPENADA
jgi:hypothetical protein